jgi:hypothetical protein
MPSTQLHAVYAYHDDDDDDDEDDDGDDDDDNNNSDNNSNACVDFYNKDNSGNNSNACVAFHNRQPINRRHFRTLQTSRPMSQALRLERASAPLSR